jgi:MFS family permease
VLAILAILILANSGYSIIAPFLPLQFKEKGINPAWVGSIFSTYSIAVIFNSPRVAGYIKLYGRRTLIQMGTFLMGVSIIAYGLLAYI